MINSCGFYLNTAIKLIKLLPRSFRSSFPANVYVLRKEKKSIKTRFEPLMDVLIGINFTTADGRNLFNFIGTRLEFARFTRKYDVSAEQFPFAAVLVIKW